MMIRYKQSIRTLRTALSLLSAGVTLLGAGTVAGQDFPTKTIRIVTGGAGGGSDFTARLIAQGISGPLGQPVIVENRAGTVGSVEPVLKVQPDGYTLLVSGATLWILSILQKTPWDTVRDFSPISLTDRTVFIVAVHSSVPARSIKDLIALAKARPGELNYSAGNIGGTTHLAVELLKSMAGINMVNINFKGGAAGITALITGEIQLTINETGLLAPHVKSGRVRALAVTSSTPSPLAPGLPTVAASGLPGYEWLGMTGIWAPAKTPPTIINRLNQEIVRALNRSDAKERYSNAGVEVVASSPEEFAAIIKSDIAKITKVVKDANIHIDQ